LRSAIRMGGNWRCARLGIVWGSHELGQIWHQSDAEGHVSVT
jgi:hypothetical protein